MSARAMPIRWRWPPENSCGYRDVWPAFSAHALQPLRHALANLAPAEVRVQP